MLVLDSLWPATTSTTPKTLLTQSVHAVLSRNVQLIFSAIFLDAAQDSAGGDFDYSAWALHVVGYLRR
ncbi:unnamed protein product [Ectocarpus sp. CCAP 1310/34]|nr:unnamed protein product [Ectocarpus sp. CCAP 1310/34]